MDDEPTIDATSDPARELAHLRLQVTELQTVNTALVLDLRAARAERQGYGTGVRGGPIDNPFLDPRDAVLSEAWEKGWAAGAKERRFLQGLEE